jgi:hypothetical protein
MADGESAAVPHCALCAYTDKSGHCRGMAGSVIIHLARHGQFFATRDSARRIIRERVDDVFPEREPVILDWSGVQAVTGAFASELAAWFLSTGRKVGSTGMNDEVRGVYESACRRLVESGGEGGRQS